jgi:hypothetical protein
LFIGFISNSFFLSRCSHSGPSERTGQIVKIASEGYINRTTEVEIIKGSLNGGSGSFGSKFDFTISNPDLIPVAQKAFDEGKEISVKYHSNAFCPLSSDTRDCIFADNIIVK